MREISSQITSTDGRALFAGAVGSEGGFVSVIEFGDRSEWRALALNSLALYRRIFFAGIILFVVRKKTVAARTRPFSSEIFFDG